MSEKVEALRRSILLHGKDFHIQTERTECGEYVPDKSGLQHYHYLQPGRIETAAEDALTHRPIDSPAWFWFNSTFAPIEPGDDAAHLVQRWQEWRSGFQKNPQSLLIRLQMLSESER